MGKGGCSGKASEGEPADRGKVVSRGVSRSGSVRASASVGSASPGRALVEATQCFAGSDDVAVEFLASAKGAKGTSAKGSGAKGSGVPSGPADRQGDPRLARLVEAARKGDTSAWNEIVEVLGGLVWSIVRGEGLGVSDGLDAVQTVWLRLVEHLQRIQEPAQLRSWVATVARREARRTRDKLRRVLILDAAIMTDGLEDRTEPSGQQVSRGPEEEMVAQEAAVALLRALSRLVPRQRSLLRLLVAEPELSYEEIAGILDIPIGSIGPTRARALQRLARDPELRPFKS